MKINEKVQTIIANIIAISFALFIIYTWIHPKKSVTKVMLNYPVPNAKNVMIQTWNDDHDTLWIQFELPEDSGLQKQGIK